MKRLLAVLLALTMTLTCAPLSALAASDDTLAKSITVEQTTQPDAELVQAIAADPFMQPVQASAPQQEQSASVDTSDISMTATNSFGKLLLDGMNGNEEENGTEFSDDNRVIGIKMNDGTATVEYVAAEAADLVVAVYTDSAAEEMVASGTVSAPATADNTGSSTVQVPVEGSIPEYYTVKAYLLDKAEHAPLSKVFTDTSKTETIVDIKNAQVGDFDPDRVINLDNDDTTNFAVVNKDTLLMKPEDAASGKNQVITADDDNFYYTIENASEKIKGLKNGQTFVYEYSDDQIFAVRIEEIQVNGDTVIIKGDDSVELSDIFDLIKVEATVRPEDFTVQTDSTTGVVQYYDDESELENAANVQESINKIDEENSAPNGAESVENGVTNEIPLNDKEGILYGKVEYGLSGKVTYYLQGMVYVAIEVKAEAVLDGGFKVKTPKSFKIPLGHAEFGIGPLATFELDPAIKFKASLTGSAYFKVESTTSFIWDNGSPSTDSTCKVEVGVKLEGEVYAGVDLGPSVRILKWVVSIEMEISAGSTVKLTTNIDDLNIDTSKDKASKHTCGVCFKITGKKQAEVSISMKILKQEVKLGKVDSGETPDYTGKWKIFVWEAPMEEGYYSFSYNEVGWGECPHKAYRVNVTFDGDSGAGCTVYKNTSSGSTSIGTLSESKNLVVYLEPGTYTLSVTVDGTKYTSKSFTVGNGECDVKFGPGKGVVNSGTCGDNLTWTLSTDGTLTISGTGSMYSFFDDTPWDVKKVKTLVVENGVTTIGAMALSDATNLTSVSLPETITSIGMEAFWSCESLTSVKIPKSVKMLWNGAFSNCDNLTDIEIQEGVETIGGYAFLGCAMTEIHIPESVMLIGDEAFTACENLETINIPSGVTKIGDRTFFSCTSLKEVHLPDGITSIGETAFSDCSSLTKINIPNSLKSIGKEAFMGCRSLAEPITIPYGATSIGSYAFYGCNNIPSIEIPDSVTQIGSSAFAFCSKLEEVKLPSALTSIESWLFNGCSSLTSVEISDGVTSIGDYAFHHCRKLDNVKIPYGATSVGEQAFTSCEELKNIELPDTLESIGTFAFYNCFNLSSIVIPDGVTVIEKDTFGGCDGLRYIQIPASVTRIEETAFGWIDESANVQFNGTREEWQNIVIDATNYGLLSAVIHCTDGDIIPTGTDETADEILPDDTDVDSTNAISFGTTTQSSETYHALFSGLTAGEDYAVIVSRSAEQPLKAENLAYIIQLPAGADGTLDVKFKAQNAEDLSYVVACRRGEDRHSIEVTHGRGSDAEAVSGKQVSITAEDRSKEGYKFSKWAVLSGDVTLANAEQAETTFVMGCQDVKLEAIYVREGHSIRVIDGTADKNTAYKDEKVTITAKDRSSEGKTFVKWNVLAGGVTLADASSPSTTFVMGTQEVTVQAVYQAANTTPGTSGGSGGGGGGGGAIALIGGAAVVAGVVAMLPAKVSGVVLSADAVLPNAAVQLVQKGAVVAQTVTDANGSFTLKAKRGAYQLNITYQDAAGQPVTQSIAVTAPAENLTLRF